MLNTINKTVGIFGFLILSLVISPKNAFGQDQNLEFPEFSLEGGTSAPCPSPELYSLQRPDQGAATRVEVGMFINDIFDVSNVDQSFKLDLYWALRWRDSRLADPARGAAYASCNEAIGKVWMPSLQVRALRDSEESPIVITFIDKDGYIVYIRRFLATIGTPLELTDFPFDSQDLAVSVDSLIGVDEVILEGWEAITGLGEELSITGWLVFPPRLEVTESYGRIRQVNFSTLTIQIPCKREMGFYVRKLIVPLTMIVFMAWAIFWIPPSMIAPQVGVGATSMLTLIAYHFTLGAILPPISYLTRADHFMLWSLVLVFLALMEAVATAGLVNYGKEKLVHKVDRVFRVGYPLAFLVVVWQTLF